jgi:sodium/pantothenate symporter
MNWTLVGISLVYFMLLLYFTKRGYKKSDSLDDFTVGGWSMGLFVNIGFFAATWISAASVLGVPSMLYGIGFAAVTGWFSGWFFANALLPILAYKLRRPQFPVRTIPEFMRLRYEPFVDKSKIQVIASLITIVGYLIYVTIQIKGIGIIVSTMTGLSYEVSLFVFLVFIMITVIGGVWSIALTDLFNTGVIVAGLILAAAFILPQVGGWNAMFAQAMFINSSPTVGAPPTEAGSLFSPLGTFTLSAMIGIFFSNSLGASVAPHWPTRLLSAKNVRTAILTPLLSTLLIAVVFICLLVLGIGGRVLIPTMPEGSGTDSIVPLLITQFMNPLIGGIVLAAIFAAALSTANGMVLHTAIALTYDIIRNMRRNKMDDKKLIRLTQVLLGVLGLLATVLALKPPAFVALAAVYVFGLFGAAFIGPLYLGLYWKRTNKQAAYAGTIVGALSYIVFSALTTMKLMPDTIPAIVLAMLISIGSMVICSYLFPAAPKEAWEPYFEEEISPETQSVVDKVMKQVEHSA